DVEGVEDLHDADVSESLRPAATEDQHGTHRSAGRRRLGADRRGQESEEQQQARNVAHREVSQKVTVRHTTLKHRLQPVVTRPCPTSHLPSLNPRGAMPCAHGMTTIAPPDSGLATPRCGPEPTKGRGWDG